MDGQTTNGARPPVMAWAMTVMIAASSVGVGVAITLRDGFARDAVVNITAAIVYASLGLVMAVRQPGNKVGWLLYVVAAWEAVNGAQILRIGDGSVPPEPFGLLDAVAIAWGNTGYFVGFLIPLILLFYIFPTGRFLNTRWSWSGWTAGLVSALSVFVGFFPKEIGPDGGEWTVTNPIGFHDMAMDEEGLVLAMFGIGFVGLALLGIPSIVLRYRRSNKEVRAQIRWVVLGLLAVVASLALTFAFPDLPDWGDSALYIVLLYAVPLSITIAVTRYRLYEIDRLISRTVAYVLIVGLLGLVYALGAVWLPSRVIGEQPPLFVAGSTLAVAALFNPLRKRIVGWVDRRFNRTSYDAQQVIDEFAEQLRDATDPEQLTAGVVAVLEETLQPSSIALWIREDPRT